MLIHHKIVHAGFRLEFCNDECQIELSHHLHVLELQLAQSNCSLLFSTFAFNIKRLAAHKITLYLLIIFLLQLFNQTTFNLVQINL